MKKDADTITLWRPGLIGPFYTKRISKLPAQN